MNSCAQLQISPREFGDIRRGDLVYLKPPVESTPLRQLAWQQFRGQIGSDGPFLVERLSSLRALLSLSDGKNPIELPLHTLTRERPLASNPKPLIAPLAGFSFGSESKRVVGSL